jgi:hypothetical protein
MGSEVIKSGVKDAYDNLKAVICRKWGEAAPISRAIAAIEEDPQSKAQAGVLEEGRCRQGVRRCRSGSSAA